jgi:hypothetical protein
MAFDAHKNFAISSVAVAPAPPLTGTSLTVTTGEGAVFPVVPFNATVCPAGVLPTSVNAEIVRVTARAGDVLTITRTQEGTNGRLIAVGDLIVASITAKALTDLETPSFVGNVSATGSYYELSRGTPIGSWIDIPYNATNFGAVTGTWTVTAGSVGTHAYTLIGKTLIMAVHLTGTATSGSPGELRVIIPAPYTTAKHTSASAQFLDVDTPLPNGNVQVAPNATYVSLFRDMVAAAFPTSASFYVLFTVTVAIQ